VTDVATSTKSVSANPLGSDSQRLLAIGGLLLIAAGMLFGELFAMIVLHPNNAHIGEAMYAASQLVPAGDVDGIMARFMAIGGFLENRGTKIDTHSHMIHMGYIALLLSMLQPWVALSNEARRRTAWLFILSAALLPPSIFAIHYLGLAYSPISYIGWGSIMADLFGGLLAVAMFIQFWGLWRYSRGDAGASMPGLSTHGNRASSVLLVGGLLLLVSGFLYGAAYAGWMQLGMAVPEVDILKSMVSHAAADQQELLGADFAAYGKYQMLRAINVATHTHINEMGILLMLLSFVQGLVAYSEEKRALWALIAVTGAVLMPVGILLEIPFGVIGSVIVNTGGLAVLLSLLAMLVGMLRHIKARKIQPGDAS
jgi:hypothetical protein